MPRTYSRKSKRQSWDKSSMVKAMEDVKNGVPVNRAATIYSIPEATLRRYVKNYPDNENLPKNAGRFKATFNDEEVGLLKKYIIDIDKRAFGLTKTQFGQLCFRFAEELGVAHRFNLDKKTAGRDFIESFMKNCGLTLRKPEATSVARLMAFNKVNVNNFFSLLKEVRLIHGFSPNQIFNIDETGFSTVPTKTPKTISPIGNRRVIKLSSAERGSNVTVVCSMNAVGSFVPPFFIFPRVRMNTQFLVGAPPGSIGVAHESGWMTADNFLNYLKHFKNIVKPGENNPILLLMDNHASHTTLEAITFCRDNNITLLGFPPHTSHKLQPLDVSFYGPLKTAYSQACDNFLVNNPGQVITIKDIARIFGIAYVRTASMSSAINGFKATGIEPFDCSIFSDSDFEPSITTDRPETISEQPNTSLDSLIVNDDHSATTSAFSLSIQVAEPELMESVVKSKSGALPPLPTANIKKSKRKIKKLPSLLISSSPVKKALEKRRKEMIRKETKRRERATNRMRQAKEKLETRKAPSSRSKLRKTKKSMKLKKNKIDLFESDDSDSEKNISYADSDNDDLNIEEDKDCILCGEEGKDEIWYQCFNCKLWAHSACSGFTEEEAKYKPWKCDFCY